MKGGPPFSVSEADVRGLFEGLDWVEGVTLVETIDVMNDEEGRYGEESEKRWRSAGLTKINELVFVIRKKGE